MNLNLESIFGYILFTFPGSTLLLNTTPELPPPCVFGKDIAYHFELL